MDRNREEAMAKARAKRRRRQESPRGRRKAAAGRPEGIADQLKVAAAAAVEKLGSALRAAAGAVHGAVTGG
jgi:hypothetical protein